MGWADRRRVGPPHARGPAEDNACRQGCHVCKLRGNLSGDSGRPAIFDLPIWYLATAEPAQADLRLRHGEDTSGPASRARQRACALWKELREGQRALLLLALERLPVSRRPVYSFGNQAATSLAPALLESRPSAADLLNDIACISTCLLLRRFEWLGCSVTSRVRGFFCPAALTLVRSQPDVCDASVRCRNAADQGMVPSTVGATHSKPLAACGMRQ